MSKPVRLSQDFCTLASDIKRTWGELTRFEKGCVAVTGLLLATFAGVYIWPEVVEELVSSTPTVPAVSPSLGSK